MTTINGAVGVTRQRRLFGAARPEDRPEPAHNTYHTCATRSDDDDPKRAAFVDETVARIKRRHAALSPSPVH